MTMPQQNDVAIPERFSYFQTIATPAGEAVKRQLERISGAAIEVPDELANAFSRSMNLGDPLGDAYIAADSTDAARPRP